VRRPARRGTAHALTLAYACGANRLISGGQLGCIDRCLCRGPLIGVVVRRRGMAGRGRAGTVRPARCGWHGAAGTVRLARRGRHGAAGTVRPARCGRHVDVGLCVAGESAHFGRVAWVHRPLSVLRSLIGVVVGWRYGWRGAAAALTLAYACRANQLISGRRRGCIDRCLCRVLGRRRGALARYGWTRRGRRGTAGTLTLAYACRASRLISGR
jgi:hypothetical protein